MPVVESERRHIIITGHGQHGKDTACEYLRDKFGMAFSGSSWTACELFIYDLMKDAFGYESPQECYDDRHNHREFWYQAILGFNTPDKARLGKIIFEDNDCYCGLRDPDELKALRASGKVSLVIWIDASERKPPESSASMKITKDDADIVLPNNGTKKAFYASLDKAYEQFIKAALGKAPANTATPKPECDLPEIKFG